IRQFEFELQYEHLMDWRWDLETRSTRLTPLGIRFETGDEFSFQVEQLYERLLPEDEFEIGGVPIRAGEYNTVRWMAELETASQRKVAADARVEFGEFWSGRRNEYGLGVTMRPWSGVNLGVEYEFNDVDLAEGAFTTSLFRIDGGWHFSPWISFTGNVQYDDVSDIVGVYTRFRWIVKPGSDLYLVYTHNWLSEGSRLWDFRGSTVSQGLATKLAYTHRF
ncbi:MAG: hydrolase, partial [Gemmatimonadota bacterium]